MLEIISPGTFPREVEHISSLPPSFPANLSCLCSVQHQTISREKKPSARHKPSLTSKLNTPLLARTKCTSCNHLNLSIHSRNRQPWRGSQYQQLPHQKSADRQEVSRRTSIRKVYNQSARIEKSMDSLLLDAGHETLATPHRERNDAQGIVLMEAPPSSYTRPN